MQFHVKKFFFDLFDFTSFFAWNFLNFLAHWPAKMALFPRFFSSLCLFGDEDKGEAESVSPPCEEVEDRGSLMVDEVTEVKMGK